MSALNANKRVLYPTSAQFICRQSEKYHFSCSRETTAKTMDVKLLKPTGHVMHQQFNIQQLYALPTLYLCVL